MTVYSAWIKKEIKGKLKKIKVWRYDFQYKKKRYQGGDYKTRTEAKEREDKRRSDLENPPTSEETPLTFLELVNRRLAHMQIWNAETHFKDTRYMAKRWVRMWGSLPADQITQTMIKEWIQKRGKSSPHTGNKEIKFLSSLFNWGKRQNPPLILTNPVDGIDRIPIKDKFIKYVPLKEDIAKVLWIASQRNSDIVDYLYAIWDTKGRMSEINRLTWEDVKLDVSGMDPWKRSKVTLYTRKKKGGNLTPRPVPLTKRLYGIFLQRYKTRDKTVPWVFWHEWHDNKTGEKVRGPYKDRPKVMKTLCRQAGVKYFKFHALRHSGASIMWEDPRVSIGSIQRILGHESSKTTEIYLHSIGEADREAMEIFEEKSEVVEIVEEKKSDGE